MTGVALRVVGGGLVPLDDAAVLREAVATIKESTTGLRGDFREFSAEVRATLSVVCNPITGYVPRSEYGEAHAALRSEFEGRFKEQAVSIRWAVGTCIGVGVLVISAMAAVIGMGVHVVR